MKGGSFLALENRGWTEDHKEALFFSVDSFNGTQHYESPPSQPLPLLREQRFFTLQMKLIVGQNLKLVYQIVYMISHHLNI
jgi:hypothetical protein